MMGLGECGVMARLNAAPPTPQAAVQQRLKEVYARARDNAVRMAQILASWQVRQGQLDLHIVRFQRLGLAQKTQRFALVALPPGRLRPGQ